MAPWTGWLSGCSISKCDGTVEKNKSSVRRTQGAAWTGQRRRRAVQAQAQAQAQQDNGARGCRSRRWRRVFMQQK